MNLVFIFGNGFDLNFGYKSRYSDVYEKYCIENNSDTEIIKSFKKDILKSHERWTDFELAVPEYAETLNNENELMECIISFQEFMMQYLQEEDNRIVEEYRNKLDFFHERYKFYCKGLTPNDETRVRNNDNGIYNLSILTFNYTSLGNLFADLWGAKKLIHIHGALRTKDGILGLDSKEQLPESKYPIDEITYDAIIKPLFNKEYDIAKVRRATNLIKSADVVCVYGASLGDSDRTWRDLIVEWLSDEKHERHLIINKHNFVDNNSISIYRRGPLARLEREKIIREWGIDESKRSIVDNRIHFPMGYNIFDCKVTLPKNIGKPKG